MYIRFLDAAGERDTRRNMHWEVKLDSSPWYLVVCKISAIHTSEPRYKTNVYRIKNQGSSYIPRKRDSIWFSSEPFNINSAESDIERAIQTDLACKRIRSEHILKREADKLKLKVAYRLMCAEEAIVRRTQKAKKSRITNRLKIKMRPGYYKKVKSGETSRLSE